METRKNPFDISHMLFSTEYTAIWLVAVIGLSLSWAALWMIQQQLHFHKRLDFEWVAQNRIRALRHGIESSLEAVATMRDLYRSSERVSSEDFQVFASSLLQRYQGIQGLMWVARVPHGMRREFEKAGGNTGEAFRIMERADHFALMPAGERASYFPVTYLTPREGNDFSRGFDLGSVPFFAELLERAQESGKMAASGRIADVYGKDADEYGLMVALPVFEDRFLTKAPIQQRRNTRGFIVGLFRLGDLSDAAVALLEPRGVEIFIRDETAPPGERFLHFYASRLEPQEVTVTGDGDDWGEEKGSRYSERIQVADREWSIICRRTGYFRSAEAFKQGPWVALFAGLVFTALLSFYLARIKENMRERLAMQQQLVEGEELFRQMTETVDAVFWAITCDATKLLYLSPAYERIFGVAATQGEKQESIILDAVPQEDQARLLEALGQIQNGGVSGEVIHRVIRVDGTTRWVRTQGFPVTNPQGQVYRIVGFIEDITEKKLADETLRASEAKLRDMFQQSPDIIMTVDPQGKILLINRSLLAFPAQRAIGRNFLALVPWGFRKWYRKALKKVFRKGKSQHFKYSTQDSQYWEGRIVPIRSDGPITAAMVIATDVTEKRNLEMQALRNARLASIGVLAAGVAHEINNPNNSIMFNASLVSRAWRDITPLLVEYYQENGDFSLGGLAFSEVRETFPQLLAEISRNSERIKQIVQNLKHMARQDTGRFNEHVDIQQVLEATTMILHSQIQKYTDVCTLEVPDDLPPVKGNSQQLEQVFINVLLNALQSLSERRRGVFIHADLSENKEGMVITFRDEGRGISERDLGRLTEPFFTTRSDSGGTGLGLSISRSIIEKHGGSMKFESHLGTGTTVRINIPTVHSA